MGTKIELDALEALALKSTPVNSWYAHGPGDQCKNTEATVRGPYHRWFTISGATDQYKEHVGDLYDDARFAAAAMNNMLPLIARIRELEKQIGALSQK